MNDRRHLGLEMRRRALRSYLASEAGRALRYDQPGGWLQLCAELRGVESELDGPLEVVVHRD